MKKLSLLLLVMLATIGSYAAVVYGTVVDNNSTPVPNTQVYVTDSTSDPSTVFLTGTTDAAGAYSITLPSSLSAGTALVITTPSCGMMMQVNAVYNGVDINADFVTCGVTTTGPDTISGYAYINGSSPSATAPAYPAVIYLIDQAWDTTASAYVLTLLDSAFTDANGWYAFSGNMINMFSTMLVKAALQPSAADYASYLPTYYGSSISWDQATPASVGSGNDITLIAGTNPGGPGFIGGSVLQGANKTTAVGDPLNKRLVLLTTAADVPVAFAVSDATGEFAFPDLAYGTYKLFGDMYGKQNPALTVTISASTPSIDNVVFEENSTSFMGHVDVTSISAVPQLGAVVVYPNPASDKLTVSGFAHINGTKTVTLISINGATVYTDATAGGSITIPVSALAAGTYVLRLQTAEGAATYSIVK